MTKATKYPFSDLTRLEVDAIIERARAERSQAIRGFLAALLRRQPKQQALLAEFATQAARVSPC
jgi:hypothetical protein